MMKTDPAKVFSKMQKFCSWRDRCTSEVENKLKQFMLNDEEKQLIFNELNSNKYFDDIRFTNSFVFSKVSYNKWGRIKIRAALRQKKIPEEYINKAIEGIDNEVYSSNIKYLIEKKQNELTRKNAENIRQKTISHLISRGYTFNEIIPYL